MRCRSETWRAKPRLRGWAAFVAIGFWVVLACAPTAPPARPTAPPARPTAPPARPTAPPTPRAANSSLSASLVRLGDAALTARDLEAAEDLFERARRADPDAAAPRIGLGRVAFAREDWAAAEAHFEAASDDPTTAADADLWLARIDQKLGREEAALVRLRRRVAADPRDAAAHAGIEAITGPAPRGRMDLPGALARTRDHPYDFRAALAAARGLRRAGRLEEAAKRLESMLWLSDLDPRGAREAWQMLRQIDPSWREWRAVPVHVYADQTIHVEPGWRFRLRFALLYATQALAPVLHVRFLPARIEAFGTSDLASSFFAIESAFDAQVSPVPGRGILAVFTARPPSPGRHERRLGQAEFLGRRMFVRLPEGEDQSRVLLHEILHLYGGVHVLPDVESLMNPSGGAQDLDRLNAAIVLQLRNRLFRGNFEEDVLDRIDLGATIAAYEAALGTNLALRNAGLSAAIDLGNTAPVAARSQARQAVGIDAHLGDVARFLAALYRRDDRPVSSAFLLEKAAVLYGPRSKKGREVAKEAREFWNDLLPPSERES